MGAEAEMAQFTSRVAPVEAQLESLRQAVQGIKDLHQDSAAVFRPAEVKAINEEYQRSVLKTSQLARSVKASIEDLKRTSAKAQSAAATDEPSAMERHRDAVIRSLGTKLKGIVLQFHAVREQVEQQQRETLKHRVKIVANVDMDEKQVDEILRTGRGEEVLRRAVEGQGVNGVALQDIVGEVNEQRGQVANLTRDLLELNQIFDDMALLVESQGGLIDDIENNVGAAVAKVQEGNKHLESALQTKRNTRKWTWIGLIVLAVIILIAVLFLVLYLRR